MGQVGRAVNGPVMWRSQLWLLTLVILWSPGVASVSCGCEGRSDFGTFAMEQPGDQCCLNFTGSSIGVLQWSVFTRWTGVRVLDLSNCNISGLQDGGRTPASLEALYLQHNRLELLPAGFLGNAPGLKILHLENNRLEVLPEALLAGSRHIREVYLGGNRLVSVPPGLFKHNLGRLTLYNNSLRCSCALFDSLTHYFAGNTNSSSGEEQPESFMCFTRNQPQGLDLQAIQRSEICRSHGLTALFVCLPLALVLSAGLCWYCCCRRRRYDFNVMSQDSHISTVEKSGLSAMGEHHYITCRGPEALPWHEKSSLTGNQLLLRPSAELLGSSRDLYEEVEIRPAGPVHSALPRADQVYLNVSKGSRVEEDEVEVEEEEEEEEEAVEGAQIEADGVSVTEEMQEADRHRLYMNKSANYYNLVPAIELDDSDHGEYENVDLS